jgi:VWFA-related protein
MMRLTFTLIGALGLGTLALAGGPPQQQPPQGFRSTTLTVPIYTTVLDKDGRLVADLEERDFEVLDNGKPVPLSSFIRDVQPISVVVALDTSGSMTPSLNLAKEAAEAFALRLLPQDRARIMSFDDRVRWGPEFTSDRDRIINFLRNDVPYGNSTVLWDGLYQAVGDLREESARKVVLVLSDGEDYGSRLDGDDVLDAAQQYHVMVYSVGLRNYIRTGPGGSLQPTNPDRFLRKLSEQTGGGFFMLSRATELNSTFSKVAEELHRQYILAFSPPVLDGKVHELQVRVKVPGMTARARRSYIAAAPK